MLAFLSAENIVIPAVERANSLLTRSFGYTIRVLALTTK